MPHRKLNQTFKRSSDRQMNNILYPKIRRTNRSYKTKAKEHKELSIREEKLKWQLKENDIINLSSNRYHNPNACPQKHRHQNNRQSFHKIYYINLLSIKPH